MGSERETLSTSASYRRLPLYRMITAPSWNLAAAASAAPPPPPPPLPPLTGSAAGASAAGVATLSSATGSSATLSSSAPRRVHLPAPASFTRRPLVRPALAPPFSSVFALVAAAAAAASVRAPLRRAPPPSSSASALPRLRDSASSSLRGGMALYSSLRGAARGTAFFVRGLRGGRSDKTTERSGCR